MSYDANPWGYGDPPVYRTSWQRAKGVVYVALLLGVALVIALFRR